MALGKYNKAMAASLALTIGGAITGLLSAITLVPIEEATAIGGAVATLLTPLLVYLAPPNETTPPPN